MFESATDSSFGDEMIRRLCRAEYLSLMQVLATVVVILSYHVLVAERDVILVGLGRRFLLREQPYSNHLFIFQHLLY